MTTSVFHLGPNRYKIVYCYNVFDWNKVSGRKVVRGTEENGKRKKKAFIIKPIRMRRPLAGIVEFTLLFFFLPFNTEI